MDGCAEGKQRAAGAAPLAQTCATLCFAAFCVTPAASRRSLFQTGCLSFRPARSKIYVVEEPPQSRPCCSPVDDPLLSGCHVQVATAELLVPFDRSAVNLGLILWCVALRLRQACSRLAPGLVQACYGAAAPVLPAALVPAGRLRAAAVTPALVTPLCACLAGAPSATSPNAAAWSCCRASTRRACVCVWGGGRPACLPPPACWRPAARLPARACPARCSPRWRCSPTLHALASLMMSAATSSGCGRLQVREPQGGSWVGGAHFRCC